MWRLFSTTKYHSLQYTKLTLNVSKRYFIPSLKNTKNCLLLDRYSRSHIFSLLLKKTEKTFIPYLLSFCVYKWSLGYFIFTEFINQTVFFSMLNERTLTPQRILFIPMSIKRLRVRKKYFDWWFQVTFLTIAYEKGFTFCFFSFFVRLIRRTE